MFIKMMVFAMAAAVFLQGCFADNAPPPDERVDGVVRILMHEPMHYTVLLQKSATSAITERQLRREWCGKTIFLADVPRDQPMWVLLHSEGQKESVGYCVKTSLIFHIHHVGDIEGAEWSHGKFGKGRTTVIQ